MMTRLFILACLAIVVIGCTSTGPVQEGQVKIKGAVFICEDLLLEYRAMRSIGEEMALMHVSNVMSLESSGRLSVKYYTLGDARRAINQCK